MRKTVYNKITSPEKLAKVNPDNIQLEKDFLDYLKSVDRAKSTIEQYEANLHIFWCWNLEYNKNKFFVNLTKRELTRFQSHAIDEWGWSPKRTRTVKATVSSLSNFIENILDDEYSDFKPIVKKIESPADIAVRDKTVFKEDELDEFLDRLVDKGQVMKACVLALAINSGRRKSELPRFKVSYFDKQNLICNGALYKTPEKVVTKGRGSRGKLLTLYILSAVDKYLELWLKRRGELGIESDWLFPKCENGIWLDEPISTTTLDSWTNGFSKELGKPFYWHSMRHFFTTKLSRANIPDSVIKQIVGWDSVEMVSVYNDTEAEETFNKYFGAEGIKQVNSGSLEDL